MDLHNLPLTDGDLDILHLALVALADKTGEVDLPRARYASDQVADHRVMMLEDRLESAKNLRDWIGEMIGVTA